MYCLYLIGAQTFFQRKGSHYLKIGHSNNIKRRFSALDCASPMRLKLLGEIWLESKESVLAMENDFKKSFRGFHVKREWFHYDDLLVKKFEGFKNVDKI